MSPTEIKKAYLDVGMTQASTARRVGVTLQQVNHVVHGRRSSTVVRRAIAEDLGMHYSRVWGEPDPSFQSPAPEVGADGEAVYSSTGADVEPPVRRSA